MGPCAEEMKALAEQENTRDVFLQQFNGQSMATAYFEQWAQLQRALGNLNLSVQGEPIVETNSARFHAALFDTEVIGYAVELFRAAFV
jgi:hypothetical protein